MVGRTHRRAGAFLMGWMMLAMPPAIAESVPLGQHPLFLAYPPENHQTPSATLFFIGSADPTVTVTVNGIPLERSTQGHFAPVIPLQVGENRFVFEAGDQRIERVVTRRDTVPIMPPAGGLAEGSLIPAQDLARLPGELICFAAIAPPQSTVLVQVGTQSLTLDPQDSGAKLPDNNTVLFNGNQPIIVPGDRYQRYEACQSFTPQTLPQVLYPRFILQRAGLTVTGEGPGSVSLLNPDRLPVVKVTANPGVARIGPSTEHSRLTPLPQGTQAQVTATEGDWLRLNYGGWIRRDETQTLATTVPPRSPIRSVGYRALGDRTEMRFPLQKPVPVTLAQTSQTLTLTLHNTTAQTDTIRLDNDPVIDQFTWTPLPPDRVEYHWRMKSSQQWGYDLRYEGSTLVLTLRHPPAISRKPGDLTGIKILLDPGHGGKESGAVGPTGYTEKAINLRISLALAEKLRGRGAIVHLTRTSDEFVSLPDRVAQINQVQPAIALSIHYNALPDSGNPNQTQGVSTFWYHPQAEALARHLQQDLVTGLQRPSHGVYWNNLALTRPAIAPAVLLELGFMIHPEEFEWITDPTSQQALVNTLADSITQWFHPTTSTP